MPLDQKIKVTFDEQMDSLTINPSTFFIAGVAGAVTFDVLSQTATFTPSTNLAANTTFTITVTVGAKDLGGVPLAAPFHQTFTTGPCKTRWSAAGRALSFHRKLLGPGWIHRHQHRFYHGLRGRWSQSGYGRYWISSGAGRRYDP